MAKRKRGPWAQWEIALPMPPTDEAERVLWEETVLTLLDRQVQIKGAAAVAMKTSALPEIDLLEVAAVLVRLLRRSRAVPFDTTIGDLRLKMDRTVSVGSVILECHRTIPPPNRIPAEVRSTISQRLRAWHEERSAA